MPKKRWIILVVTLLVVGLVIAVVMSKSPKWLYQGVQSGIRRVGFSLVPYNLFNKEVKSGNYEVKGEVDGYEIKLVDQVALDIVSDRRLVNEALSLFAELKEGALPGDIDMFDFLLRYDLGARELDSNIRRPKGTYLPLITRLMFRYGQENFEKRAACERYFEIIIE